MKLFQSKNKDVREEQVIAVQEDHTQDINEAIHQLAKYQKKQIDKIMEEDFKMFQDIGGIEEEFGSIESRIGPRWLEAYERNDFSKPRCLHLSIHRR